MHRYFIYFAYDGKNYHGWQIQPNANSVQEEMMNAMSTILREPIKLAGAGRTDTGVHAKKMVAHFDINREIDCNRLTDKMNRLLPPDIIIHSIKEVNPEIHARFNATAREYKYYISLKKQAFNREYTYRVYRKPDIDLMNKAAEIIMSYDDFTSFSKLHTSVKTNICKITKAKWEKIDEDNYVFTIRADRFLRNMVRAIVGTLIEVGNGKISLEELHKIIQKKDRCEAGTSAPGNALFIVDVEYPDSIFCINNSKND